MPVDPQKLLAFQIPSMRQVVHAQDAAFYSLSIGLGQSALDRRPLRFTCADHPDFSIFPGFALVVAHPGFWLGDPESGVNAKMVLHASQSLQMLGPLPVGEAVSSRSRVTALVDKGPGKAALIDTETVIEDARGKALALLNRTTFVRHGGGFGGDNPASAGVPPAPSAPPTYVVIESTRPEQALFYRMNGDLNPLHSDPDVAAQAGFPAPILHGLCTAGVVIGALLRTLANYDASRLDSVKLRFAGPMFPGESIRIEIWDNGRFHARVVERDTIVIDQGQVEVKSA